MRKILLYVVATLLLVLAPSVLTAQETPSRTVMFPQAVPVVLPGTRSVVSLPPTAPPLAHHVTVGAAIGAGAGLAAVGLVLLTCGNWCSHDRLLGITLYVGGGAAAGAAAGALVWAVRR